MGGWKGRGAISCVVNIPLLKMHYIACLCRFMCFDVDFFFLCNFFFFSTIVSLSLLARKIIFVNIFLANLFFFLLNFFLMIDLMLNSSVRREIYCFSHFFPTSSKEKEAKVEKHTWLLSPPVTTMTDRLSSDDRECFKTVVESAERSPSIHEWAPM